MSFSSSEQELIFELLEVLHGSLDLHEALGRAYPVLRRLVPAEHGALCISKPEDPTLYDWAVAELPEGFFRGYAEIAPFDFVRASVSQMPNVVLRDTEMSVNRTALAQSRLYQFSRESHMPIEHVMAVMLAPESSWHGGLTLYRSDLGAFSDREREIVQFLAPYFANAVANCKRFSDEKRWSSLLNASLSLNGVEVIIFTERAIEVARSGGVDRLLDRCFGPRSAGADGLPPALAQYLCSFFTGRLPISPPLPWIPPISGAGLVVSFMPIVKDCRTHWAVVLDEIPPPWRERLTPAEIDVTVRVAQGWDNELVARDVGNKVMTAKTHIYRIYNKLGVSTRSALIARWRARS